MLTAHRVRALHLSLLWTHTGSRVRSLSLTHAHPHPHVQHNTHFPLPPPGAAAVAPGLCTQLQLCGSGPCSVTPRGTKRALPFITSSPVPAESKIRQVTTATMKHFTPFLFLGFGSETTQEEGGYCQGWGAGAPRRPESPQCE